MAIFGIICLILLVGAGILFYLQKTGKIGDRDKDFIPDVIEDTVEKAKKRVKSIKKEAKEAKAAIKKLKMLLKQHQVKKEGEKN